ncbi:DNA adenine methylase [Azoarcus communis]|nr:DNA adenine methylase [Parazoarcus communis]
MLKPSPVIPWIGGKRRLAKHIIPQFPEHACYVEPFAGGAAVFFLKAPVKSEVINDINGELVNLYRVIQSHLDEFIRQFRWSLSSRQMFDWAKQQATAPLTDIQRAARFFYLQRLAFGGKVDGQNFGVTTTSGPRFSLLRVEEDLSAAHIRLSQATIEHMPWAKCVERYDRPHTLFYCDPPYWGTEGYGVVFGIDQYDQMASLAKSIQGRMMISVNDIPEMRQAFAGLRMERLEINYTVGGNRSGGRQSGELLIRNW